MDAAQALADLMEISSQVEAAVVLDEGSGEVVASTLPDERAARLADVARELLATAGDLAGGDRPIGQLEAATVAGSIFVVRDDGRTIAAATGTSPTVGLVFYDLKTCLRALEQAPKQPRRRKKADA